ncbi:hypothetical protein EGH24_13865 [Halonotius terrestris]|uniref:Uncharacterized protein n=1 Tax=Halonotius terrestris TaxID=2487750 RepID=A0A8J8P9L4_9EURY|nr:hypothetical protein [Halonotius terrestris]TQQ78604.1 hypothetical protein EGH24_13865 [Halonotius terrestris]
MAKGIVAFFSVVALILAISMLSGIGFYQTLQVEYDSGADADVQAAADAMVGQEATDQSSDSVLQDFTTSAGRTLATGWQVIANLGGILKLLFGVPDVLATTIQTFFQMVFGVSFAAFIRGVVLQ